MSQHAHQKDKLVERRVHNIWWQREQVRLLQLPLPDGVRPVSSSKCGFTVTHSRCSWSYPLLQPDITHLAAKFLSLYSNEYKMLIFRNFVFSILSFTGKSQSVNTHKHTHTITHMHKPPPPPFLLHAGQRHLCW